MKKFILFLLLSTPIINFAQQWTWVKTNGTVHSVNNSKIKTNNSGEVFSAFTNSFQPSSILFKRENNSGTLVWSKTIGGSNTFIEDISADQNNNAYILGQFANNLILPDTTITNTTGYEMFLVAYNSAGVRKWVKTFPGGILASSFIANDQMGNLIFVSAKAISSNTTVTINKYNSNGSQLYSKTYSHTTKINDLKIDKLNNIFFSGTFENSGLTLNGTMYYPGGNTGYSRTTFIAKLNPNGDIKKVHTYPGVYLKNFAIDSTCMNYYLAGYFSDSAKIGQTKVYTSCNTNTNSPAICEERLLARVDTNNICSWSKKSFIDEFAAMDISKSGSIFLTGKFRDTLSMDGIKMKESISNRYATFVIKLSSLGMAAWAVKDSGTTTTTGTYPQDIAYSENGSVYLSGTFHNFQNNSYLGQFTLPITGTVSNYFSAKLMDAAIPTTVKSIIKNKDEILIYPNPGNGRFITSGAINAVYNILGQKINFKTEQESGNKILEINQGAGIYFVQFEDHKGTLQKIIIQ